jgi:FtsP/CotA-like multicopper oxidase with cupredoxin domain
MHRKLFKALPGLLLAVVLMLIISVPVFAVSRPARPPAQALTPGPVTVNLYAMPGTLSLNGGSASASIWGFTTSSTGPATLPGPVIDVVAGSVVTITLTNNLPQNVSLLIPGMALVPDSVGVAPGNTATYVFTASEPGTYLYQSGVNPQVQALMGLYGVMIVRPTTAGQAYNDPATAYDAEAVLVLSEIDPNLNLAIGNGTYGSPGAPTLLDYAPDYWLINGEVYPDTNPVAAISGQRVLLRTVNAGAMNHTLQLLGMHMRGIAQDGFAYTYPFETFSPTIAAGQTQDFIATMPGVSAPVRFPLFNRQERLTNVASFPGGMMTMLEVTP